MSKHKISRDFPMTGSVIVRRKGKWVRWFNRDTARMSGWMIDVARPAARGAAPMTFYALSLLTVAMLKQEAADRGIPFKSKARKGDLIAALTGTALAA